MALLITHRNIIIMISMMIMLIAGILVAALLPPTLSISFMLGLIVAY